MPVVRSPTHARECEAYARPVTVADGGERARARARVARARAHACKRPRRARKHARAGGSERA
eukprot:1724673-Pleurochrysis_carterae.AAC.1